jgi:hypothetical protein
MGCDRYFRKGEVYYKERSVFKVDEKIYASEWLICPRCKYKSQEQIRRFKEFKHRCIHPEKFVYTNYHYIPGGCIQEPDYDQCRLCGKHLGA